MAEKQLEMAAKRLRGEEMRRTIRLGSIAAVCLAVVSLAGCMAFGYGIFSKADVVITGKRTAQVYDMYFAEIDFKVTNSGTTHIGTCEITFKVTCQDGKVFKDVAFADNLDPGDVTTGQALIETNGSPIAEAKVVDIKRFSI